MVNQVVAPIILTQDLTALTSLLVMRERVIAGAPLQANAKELADLLAQAAEDAGGAFARFIALAKPRLGTPVAASLMRAICANGKTSVR